MPAVHHYQSYTHSQPLHTQVQYPSHAYLKVLDAIDCRHPDLWAQQCATPSNLPTTAHRSNGDKTAKPCFTSHCWSLNNMQWQSWSCKHSALLTVYKELDPKHSKATLDCRAWRGALDIHGSCLSLKQVFCDSGEDNILRSVQRRAKVVIVLQVMLSMMLEAGGHTPESHCRSTIGGSS